MIEILKGGIGGTGCIARTTGRQDVCTTILPPGALAGEQAFRKHFVSCNQTRDSLFKLFRRGLYLCSNSR